MAKVEQWFSGGELENHVRYRMRCKVFGWGPVDVYIVNGMVRLCEDPSQEVPVADVPNWVEFKRIG